MTKPGCLLNAKDDEPVFILRGQDYFMPHAIEAWADMVEAESPNNPKVAEARRFAREVRDWQSHPDNEIKVPD